MSVVPHIAIALRQADVNGRGKYTHVKIRRVEETLTESMPADNAYSKYMDSIIMHALSWANGEEIKENKGFPYTFTFTLS